MTDVLAKLECVAWRYISWPALLCDFKTHGFSMAEISRALNVPPSTLDNWKNGHEPRYSHGEALLLLHSRLLGADCTRNRIKGFRDQALMRSSAPATKGERTHAESRRESRRAG
jgi:hypothetical protein